MPQLRILNPDCTTGRVLAALADDGVCIVIEAIPFSSETFSGPRPPRFADRSRP